MLHAARQENIQLHIIREGHPACCLNEQTEHDITRVVIVKSLTGVEFHRQVLEHRQEILKTSERIHGYGLPQFCEIIHDLFVKIIPDARAVG
ncbi:hypothetical protein D3C81_1577410 [compost metagenome]